MEKIKIIVSFHSYLTHYTKLQKNSKKLKKYHYGSISSHHRLKEDEKGRKKKIIVPFRSYPTFNIKSQKNGQKIQKIKKYHYGSISSHHRLKEDEKGRKFQKNSKRMIENSKKIAKKFKKLNNTIMAPFLAKIGWKRMRKGENKNYRFVPFLPSAE